MSTLSSSAVGTDPHKYVRTMTLRQQLVADRIVNLEKSNEAFRDKILDVRSVLSGIGPENVGVRCYFATNGLTITLSPEYQQEVIGFLQNTTMGHSLNSL